MKAVDREEKGNLEQYQIAIRRQWESKLFSYAHNFIVQVYLYGH